MFLYKTILILKFSAYLSFLYYSTNFAICDILWKKVIVFYNSEQLIECKTKDDVPSH